MALVVLLSTGCGKQNHQDAERRWKMEDLRALEMPEAGLPPESDLVAAYARRTGADLEMRFDLLGSPDPFGYTLTLLLDTQDGGSSQTPWGAPSEIAWDLGLIFPPAGLGHSFTADGVPSSVRPRIIRLEIQDAAVVRLSKAGLEKVRFQAYLTPAGVSLPADAIGPVSTDGPGVTDRAPLLLAFTNTLPSATPAQALRRWDGAHTGPYGQRHGLSVLLDAAQKNGVPLALLDLKQAGWLPVLEALGGLKMVGEMAKTHQLLLPEVACGGQSYDAGCLKMNRQSARQFGLPETTFLYRGSEQAAQREFQAAFAPGIRTACEDNGIPQIPLPDDNEQVSELGLEPAIREGLLRSALMTGASPITILGGSLPTSPWGDSLIAGPSMEYIAGHPWIDALSIESLLENLRRSHLPACPAAPEAPRQTDPRKVALQNELSSLPDGVLARQAEQTFLRLTEQVEDDRLQALRSEYLGIVSLLVAAARWEANPTQRSDCALDIDGDGAADCVLSSDSFFTIIQPRGGRVTIAAARVGDQVVQVVGPRSQLITGLSDPLDWRLGQAYGSDPQEIPGAFGDPPMEWTDYRAETAPGRVTLTHPGGTMRKTFNLLPDGLHAAIETTRTGSSSIPLILIDMTSGEPGWLAHYRTRSDPSAGVIVWGMENGPSARVNIRGAAVTFTAFTDSLSMLQKPEDPDVEMPPGAFLPFPMSLVNIQYEGSYQVEIVVSKND